MTALHQLQPVTLDFFETAPLRVRCTLEAKCTPEVLFETLRGDSVWVEWAGVIKHVEWTSEEPHTKNSTRDFRITGNFLVGLLFFQWVYNVRVAL